MTAGKLSIVGTPIGNLEDITLRALRALREADIIAAEDTRRTAQLLARHGIGVSKGSDLTTKGTKHTKTEPIGRDAPAPILSGLPRVQGGRDAARPYHRLISYHEFNEAKRTPELLQKLKDGLHIALVCDAGMPTLSDPGLRLVRAVVEANEVLHANAGHVSHHEAHEEHEGTAATQRGPTGEIQLEIIPGPSAVTMALAASGFVGSPAFAGVPALFYGFLPHKSGQRRKTLSTLHALPFTLVFFESPYRLVKSLSDMRELLGNRQAVVARELTKKFEEIIRGDLDTILKKLENRVVKGEITVVVEGSKE
jgi:16S rRNA (cytidine1402-2'-O)-methyltransferase